jgi:hypothetical protein
MGESGQSGLFRKETTMGKEARNKEDLDLSPEVEEKFDELVALLSSQGFGPEGPPLDTTFAEIEAFGHSAGRMVARAIDKHLAEQHGEHFEGENPCPGCGQLPEEPTQHKERPLQTDDGDIRLKEPTCHCSVCNRSFFPSAHNAAT